MTLVSRNIYKTDDEPNLTINYIAVQGADLPKLCHSLRLRHIERSMGTRTPKNNLKEKQSKDCKVKGSNIRAAGRDYMKEISLTTGLTTRLPKETK